MLALREVSKTFMAGTADAVRALDRVSLVLEPGDFVTIIGSNGAGKSTLLNAIGGLVLPDCGRIGLDGADITLAPVHRRADRPGRAEPAGEHLCVNVDRREPGDGRTAWRNARPASSGDRGAGA
jgi:ABC-type branched-subunit amino acid transport system ATPase component